MAAKLKDVVNEMKALLSSDDLRPRERSRKVLELALRNASVAEMRTEFGRRIAPFLERCGLTATALSAD